MLAPFRFRPRAIRAVQLEDRLLLCTVPELLAMNGGEMVFEAATAQYCGNAISRPGHYDLQPSAMYDPTDIDQPYKMWFLGHHPTGDPGDRIYYSHSLDGTNWSDPVVALAPQLGVTGENEADDHLLGSPAVVKVDGTYFMYYEAYSMWATAIQEFFSFDRGDTWISNGTPQPHLDPSYIASGGHQGALGVAPTLPKHDTHPVYSGEVQYSFGKSNRFLSLEPFAAHTDSNGHMFSPLHDGHEAFHLYDSPATGRSPLYQYFDLTNSNNYVVKNLGDVLPNSVPAPGLIGYAADDLQSNDMIGALQNQIMLATSTDGINWTRFEGLDRGHAVVTPRNEYAARFDVETGQPPLECLNDENRIHEEWDIHRSYGSGFPGALVRDGFVELYFTDDSERSECFGGFFNEHFRIRVPLEEINSAQAYRDADAIVGGNRQEAFYGEDIKYSPLFERYFIIGFNSYDSDPDPEVNTIAPGPTVAWSDYHPDASIAPKSANALYNISRFTGELPLGDHPRTANGRGAILGNELGHTLDFPRGVPPHSAFHLYYEAFPTGIADNSFAELDHILVFGFHENSPTISVAGDNIVEGDQTSSRIEFVATLSNSHHIPIRVQYSTQSGSASSGSDYVEQTGFIEFSPGQTEVRVSIEVLSDRIDESNETFHLNLFDPENSAIAIGQATAVIIDDDTVTVAERLVYYHDSYFDGDTLNSAIDPTVSAFRHNQTSTSVNMTGYVHGLNGVVIDIVDLASETVLTSGSFVIRAGRTSNTAQWNIVQSSPAVDLHVGAGANGSDRVVLTWRDGTIVNTWIEITVKADAATGLANDDIFYFGNQIGDVNGDGFTNATDYQIVRTNTKTVLDPAMVDDDFDLNKDGQVNTIDLLVVRDHATILGANLPIITPGNGQPLLNKNDFPSILPERRQIRRRDEVAEALSQLEETTDEMAEITDLAILAEFDESDRFNSARMALKLTRPA